MNDADRKYSELAAKLGDVEFKLQRLATMKADLIKEIDTLNTMVAMSQAQQATIPSIVPKGDKNDKAQGSSNSTTRGSSTP